MPFFRSTVRHEYIAGDAPYDDSYYIKAEIDNIPVAYGMPEFTVNALGSPSNTLLLNADTKIYIGANVTDCNYLLAQSGYNTGWTNYFNNDIVFEGNKVKNLKGFLLGAICFNRPFIIPNSVNDCCALLSRAENFNQPLIIPENVDNCSYMLSDAIRFNQPLTIPENVKDISYLLADADNMNCAITIVNRTASSLNLNLTYMLRGLSYGHTTIRFNNVIHMPYICEYSNMSEMFRNSISYNQVTFVPGTKGGDCRWMFNNCTNFGSDVYVNTINIDSVYPMNVYGMFGYCNNQKRKNVHFHRSLNNLFNNTSKYSIIGYSSSGITWTTMVNGFYNVAYNVFCYYNYNYMNGV